MYSYEYDLVNRLTQVNLNGNPLRNYSYDGFAEIFRPLLWGQEEMWMPCLVYYFQDDWYVVSIQNVYCKECGWKGKIACPTVDDAFVGLKNKQDRINNVFKLHFFDCPECGGRLSSNAIWIESK